MPVPRPEELVASYLQQKRSEAEAEHRRRVQQWEEEQRARFEEEVRAGKERIRQELRGRPAWIIYASRFEAAARAKFEAALAEEEGRLQAEFEEGWRRFEEAVKPELHRSAEFWAGLGYPEYALKYAPVELPPGAVVTRVEETAEGLRVEYVTAEQQEALRRQREELERQRLELEKQLEESRRFWEGLGYPEYAGRYAPVEFPEGAKITRIEETAEGLRIEYMTREQLEELERLQTQLRASEEFWSKMGYPEYAGKYAPVQLPEGAVVTSVAETPEGLRIEYKTREQIEAEQEIQRKIELSREFWMKLGYPEFAGRYEPIDIPEGAKITRVEETAEGLRVEYSVAEQQPVLPAAEVDQMALLSWQFSQMRAWLQQQQALAAPQAARAEEPLEVSPMLAGKLSKLEYIGTEPVELVAQPAQKPRESAQEYMRSAERWVGERETPKLSVGEGKRLIIEERGSLARNIQSLYIGTVASYVAKGYDVQAATLMAKHEAAAALAVSAGMGGLILAPSAAIGGALSGAVAQTVYTGVAEGRVPTAQEYALTIGLAAALAPAVQLLSSSAPSFLTAPGVAGAAARVTTSAAVSGAIGGAAELLKGEEGDVLKGVVAGALAGAAGAAAGEAFSMTLGHVRAATAEWVKKNVLERWEEFSEAFARAGYEPGSVELPTLKWYEKAAIRVTGARLPHVPRSEVDIPVVEKVRWGKVYPAPETLGATYEAWELTLAYRTAGVMVSEPPPSVSPMVVKLSSGVTGSAALLRELQLKRVLEEPMPEDWLAGWKKTPEELEIEKIIRRGEPMPGDWLAGFRKETLPTVTFKGGRLIGAPTIQQLLEQQKLLPYVTQTLVTRMGAHPYAPQPASATISRQASTTAVVGAVAAAMFVKAVPPQGKAEGPTTITTEPVKLPTLEKRILVQPSEHAAELEEEKRRSLAVPLASSMRSASSADAELVELPTLEKPTSDRILLPRLQRVEIEEERLRRSLTVPLIPLTLPVEARLSMPTAQVASTQQASAEQAAGQEVELRTQAVQELIQESALRVEQSVELSPRQLTAAAPAPVWPTPQKPPIVPRRSLSGERYWELKRLDLGRIYVRPRPIAEFLEHLKAGKLIDPHEFRPAPPLKGRERSKHVLTQLSELADRFTKTSARALFRPALPSSRNAKPAASMALTAGLSRRAKPVLKLKTADVKLNLKALADFSLSPPRRGKGRGKNA